MNIGPKAQLVKALVEELPRNSLGLLEGIYRPDLLPDPTPADVTAGTPPRKTGESHQDTKRSAKSKDSRNGSSSQKSNGTGELLPAVTSKSLQTSPGDRFYIDNRLSIDRKFLVPAYMPMSYEEGFPSLLDSRPLWFQMDFEPYRAFGAFQAYLDQGRSGARQLFILHELLESDASPFVCTLDALQDFFHLYYWKERVQAYDLFERAHNQQVREKRVLAIENKHYTIAEALLAKCEEYLGTDTFTDEMDGKLALEALKAATTLQRTALGLPANGPLQKSGDGVPQGASMEVLLRTIAKDAHAHTDSGEKRQVNLDKLLHDEETASIAQELIIKVNQAGS